MIIPFPPRIFVTLSFILGLAACHCVRGPTARGVGVGPLGFGATAEAGAVIGLRVFKPGSTPRLAVSPGGRFVAGVFVGYGLIATFLVEFSPEPRIRRAPSWIQLGTEPLTGVVTAVSDDGQQMIRATGS
ncbi:MAG: hypothetical protein CVU65_15375, partial [Deltaproteobacteria bacterium HGW-Deltaproteobacteria-22]